MKFDKLKKVFAGLALSACVAPTFSGSNVGAIISVADVQATIQLVENDRLSNYVRDKGFIETVLNLPCYPKRSVKKLLETLIQFMQVRQNDLAYFANKDHVWNSGGSIILARVLLVRILNANSSQEMLESCFRGLDNGDIISTTERLLKEFIQNPDVF